LDWSKAKKVLVLLIPVIAIFASVFLLRDYKELTWLRRAHSELERVYNELKSAPPKVVYVSLKMGNVNRIVDLLEKQGNMEAVYRFFYLYVRNIVTAPGWEEKFGKQDPETTSRIVHALINSARKYDIPLTLAFALAEWEGGFYPKNLRENGMVVVNVHGKLVKMKSKDIGLLQGNNRTFLELGWIRSEEELYNIETNADLCLKYFRAKYDENGDGNGKSWFKAPIAYNSGSALESKELKMGIRGGRITIGHLVNIMQIEEKIRAKFCEVFGESL
jgi:soluble lytic murein transglycosylase-like protein